jgi:hypothetical protein
MAQKVTIVYILHCLSMGKTPYSDCHKNNISAASTNPPMSDDGYLLAKPLIGDSGIGLWGNNYYALRLCAE